MRWLVGIAVLLALTALAAPIYIVNRALSGAIAQTQQKDTPWKGRPTSLAPSPTDKSAEAPIATRRYERTPEQERGGPELGSTPVARKDRTSSGALAADSEIHTTVDAAAPLFSQSDLSVLRGIIAINGLTEASSAGDYDDGDGDFEATELGFQEWQGGRLVALYLGPSRDFSFSYQIRELPESIGQLDALQILGLGWNELEALPEAIGDLANLEELRLHDNRITSLPQAIGDLLRLEELFLGHNELHELPANVGYLTSLRALHLNDNPLWELPEEIGDLTKLEVLNLSRGFAPGDETDGQGLSDLPLSLSYLDRLKHLYLAGNALNCDVEVLDPSTGVSGVMMYGFDGQNCLVEE